MPARSARPRRRHLVLALLTALAVTLALPATATAAPAAAPAAGPTAPLALPAPTGPLPVGTEVLHLVDRSRPDPWVPSSGPRQLMVTMFYPTVTPFGAPERYMTPAESREFVGFEKSSGQLPADVPGDALAAVRTHAVTGGLPAVQPGGRPLVVLSPGFSLPRSSLTGLAVELASRGYEIALVGHNYEAAGTELPDGTVTSCVACDKLEDGSQDVPIRRADVSFLLDRLLGPQPAWRYGWTIDRRHIGMAGHSIGGASAETTMAADRRVVAGVNMDGSFFDRVPDGFDRPFMLLGTSAVHRPGGADPTWDQAWARFGGPRHWFTVAGTDHFSFTDYAPLSDQLGVRAPDVTIDGARATAVTRAYVGAFLDRYLRGRPTDLLDRGSPRYPEVTVEHPR